MGLISAPCSLTVGQRPPGRYKVIVNTGHFIGPIYLMSRTVGPLHCLCAESQFIVLNATVVYGVFP